jgi:aspartyl-tRNA(Asn)/glutamyl-tRNA(Gln) amidotransferase subunit C
MSDLTKKEVEHIANLARIKLTEKEEEKMAKELGAILGYIDKLNEVDTSGVVLDVKASSQLANVFRPDEPNGSGQVEPSKLIEQAPDRDGNYLKVKEVFENYDNS